MPFDDLATLRGSAFCRFAGLSADLAAFCFGAGLAFLGFAELFADAFGCTLRFEGFAKAWCVEGENAALLNGLHSPGGGQLSVEHAGRRRRGKFVELFSEVKNLFL